MFFFNYNKIKLYFFSNWLKGSWFSGHYHICAPNRMYNWQPNKDVFFY